MDSLCLLAVFSEYIIHSNVNIMIPSLVVTKNFVICRNILLADDSFVNGEIRSASNLVSKGL